MPTEPPIYVMDFEGDRRSGVVEFGVVTLRGSDIAGTATRLCRPREALRPEDTFLHGIRDEAAAQAEPFEAEFERFRDFRATGPFAAHHASVEMGLLKLTWAFPPRSPDFSSPTATDATADWGPWLDTRRLYATAYPQMASHKLSALITETGLQEVLDTVARDHCPIDRAKYHCALYDALACALLLLAFRDQPPAGFEQASIAALVRASYAKASARNNAQQGWLFE